MPTGGVAKEIWARCDKDGECCLKDYPIARVMCCPRPHTQEDVDAAKEAFILATLRSKRSDDIGNAE